MNIVVISCSLDLRSRSYVLARQAVDDLEKMGVDVRLYDLREYKLPLSDVDSARQTPAAETLEAAISEACAIIMAVPIYNFYANAAAKNLVELVGGAWNNKLVGFMCVAGGRSSYMAVMSLANSLMLDFRCLIVPRFVYATGDDFENDQTEEMSIGSDDVRARVTELAETTVRLAQAIESAGIG
ncbi:MAG: NADPH-dependent FMN reductase [Candidatus Poribacteria bacterium]